MELLGIFDVLVRYAERFLKSDALAGKEEGEWVKYSTNYQTGH